MLASAVLVACSSESSSGDDGAKPELEGELCVDVNDACCCDEELELVENGPSCRINFAGDLPALTFELVTASGATVLPEVASAAACGAEGGWFISSTSVEGFWDDKEHRDLRVVASIDDGGLRAFLPFTDAFTISPSGSLTEHSAA